MVKTKEEYEALNNKPKELTDDVLKEVNGGVRVLRIKQECPNTGCKYNKDNKTSCPCYYDYECRIK